MFPSLSQQGSFLLLRNYIICEYCFIVITYSLELVIMQDIIDGSYKKKILFFLSLSHKFLFIIMICMLLAKKKII